MSVTDPVLQNRLLTEAGDRHWSLRELDQQIRDMKGDPNTVTAQVEVKGLQAKRGEPYLYRTIEKNGRLALDLGFRDSHPLSDRVASNLTSGEVVRSAQDGRYEDGYRIASANQRVRLYAYPARVERIIDGDTLWATMDLGFDTWADRKLRLRGIDCPERKKAAGLRAKDALIGILEAVDVFVVTTTKIDLYDRYLADLFVLEGETDPGVIARNGVYVNRQLIQDGFARLWSDEKPPEF